MVPDDLGSGTASSAGFSHAPSPRPARARTGRTKNTGRGAVEHVSRARSGTGSPCASPGPVRRSHPAVEVAQQEEDDVARVGGERSRTTSAYDGEPRPRTTGTGLPAWSGQPVSCRRSVSRRLSLDGVEAAGLPGRQEHRRPGTLGDQLTHGRGRRGRQPVPHRHDGRRDGSRAARRSSARRPGGRCPGGCRGARRVRRRAEPSCGDAGTRASGRVSPCRCRSRRRSPARS